MQSKTVHCRDWLGDQQEGPEFRQAYEELAPAHQIARLRILQGLTQEELARSMGTAPSTVARLENGRRDVSLSTLRKAAEAFGAELTISLRPRKAP